MEQLALLPYGGSPPAVAGSLSSVEAAESMKEASSSIRSRVFRYFLERSFSGATCDQIEVALRLRHQIHTGNVRFRQPMEQHANAGCERSRSGQ